MHGNVVVNVHVCQVGVHEIKSIGAHLVAGVANCLLVNKIGGGM